MNQVLSTVHPEAPSTRPISHFSLLICAIICMSNMALALIYKISPSTIFAYHCNSQVQFLVH